MTINKRDERIWNRLVQTYGTRLADLFGPKMPEEWIRVVDDLTGAQIDHGLKVLRRESPVYPPTLGQFQAACQSLPAVAAANHGPTIQEELLEFAARQVKNPIRKGAALDERLLYSRPWNYVYREWRDESRPRGFERCAECIGIVLDMPDGKKIGWSVAQMMADKHPV